MKKMKPPFFSPGTLAPVLAALLLPLFAAGGWARGKGGAGGWVGYLSVSSPGGGSSSNGHPSSGQGEVDFFHSEAFFHPRPPRAADFYTYPYNGGNLGYARPFAPSPVAEAPAGELPEELANGDVVVNVQRALKALGYYDGPVNGLSDTPTRMAIRAYSLKAGLTPTGCIDKQLLMLLGLL